MKRSFILPSLAVLSIALSFMGAAGAADTAPAATPTDGKKVDWENMTFDQRKKLMKSAVLPELKKAFQSFDAKKYQKFTCATCHGDGATDGKFKMPNAKLPKLPPPTDRAAFAALQTKKPEAVKFMGTVVTPKVAALLGLPEWSPQNPKGFGCYACHTSGDAAK
jgi:cytochrome c553